MTTRDDQVSDSQKLCTSCGICCKGYAFNYGLIQKEEIEPLRTTSVSVYRHADNSYFSMPCPALANNSCTIYALRPKTCVEFKCALLQKVTKKQITLPAALEIVRHFNQSIERLQQDEIYQAISAESIVIRRNLEEVNKLFLNSDDLLSRKKYGKTSLLLHLAHRLISAHFGHGVNSLFDEEEPREALRSFRPGQDAKRNENPISQVTAGEARDIRFWRSLAPEFNICAPASFKRIKHCEFGQRELDDAQQRLIIEGYFKAKCEWMADCNKLAELARRLCRRGLPSVFAFVYDEFWFPTFQLHPILTSLLSRDYFMLPDFWVGNIDPAHGGAGSRPRRDKGRESLNDDGSPKSVTIWIPLTEATPLNGCMYLVPAYLDPTYNTPGENRREFEYASIRALPAAKGEFFVWNQAVLYWGGKSSPTAVESRISMALEFQRADVAAFNTPLIRPLSPPAFETRLELIAKQVLQYQHMYHVDGEMIKLVKELSGVRQGSMNALCDFNKRPTYVKPY